MRRRGIADLGDRLALVTGAGSGIGKETSLALAREGCGVIVVDIDEASAEKTAGRCAELGVTSEPAWCDVADADAVARLAERVLAEHGPLDVLVANAGVGLSGRFLDTTLDDWRWIRGVNLDGVVHCCHAFGAAMVERGSGHVVVLSSGLGYTPRATEPAYVTTKAAVLALAQSLRADWRRAGVGVSAVCPGVIDTPIIDHTRFLGDAGRPDRRARATRAFRRGHPPHEVATAIVDAIRRDRAIVPVGREARAGWWLHRYGPLRLQQLVARLEGP